MQECFAGRSESAIKLNFCPNYLQTFEASCHSERSEESQSVQLNEALPRDHARK